MPDADKLGKGVNTSVYEPYLKERGWTKCFGCTNKRFVLGAPGDTGIEVGFLRDLDEPRILFLFDGHLAAYMDNVLCDHHRSDYGGSRECEKVYVPKERGDIIRDKMQDRGLVFEELWD